MPARRTHRKFLLLLAVAAALRPVAAADLSADLLMVGGGASGPAASRLGGKTVLMEETTWLGGMLSAAGVSASDENHNLPSGIGGEFREKLYRHYGGPKAGETGWVSNTLFAPAVADKPDSVADTSHGAAAIADSQRDPWVEGSASHTPEAAVLQGTYGVLYEMTIHWRSSDGRGLALRTRNARGGANNWCGGMATTVVVSPGRYPGGIVKLPSDKPMAKQEPEAVVIQVFPLAAKGAEQVTPLTCSPPGASCLPTPITLVPVRIDAK